MRSGTTEKLSNRNFEEYRPLIPVLVALILGILFDAFFLISEPIQTSFSQIPFVWRAVFLFFVGVLLYSWKHARVKMFGVNVFLLFGVAFFGGFYHHLYWNFYPETELGLRIQEPGMLAKLEGTIARPPIFTFPSDAMIFAGTNADEVSTIFQIHVSAFHHSKTHRTPASGTVIVRVVGRAENLHSGDFIRVSGRLVRPSEEVNPGLFSPRTYYRRERILSILRVPSVNNVEILARPRVWKMFRIVEFLRNTALQRLEKYLTPTTKPMAAALILGCRDEISNEDLTQMLETGTIHIMAISGLHVGLLASGFFIVCRLMRASRGATFLCVLFCTWLYVLVSGARPPAIRAGVIVTITTISYIFCARHSQLNALAAAGILVLLLNPTALFSTGTQLSFLAVGTLFFTPILRHQPKSQDGSDEQALSQSQKNGQSDLKNGIKRKRILNRQLRKRIKDENQKKQRTYLKIPFLKQTEKHENIQKDENQKETNENREMSLSLENLLVPNAPRMKIVLHFLKRSASSLFQLLYSSILMTVVLLPLVVRAFHVASFAGIFLNVLLWLPLMVAMMCGSATVIFGSVPFLGNFFGWCCSNALSVMDWMIHTTATLPAHCFWMRGTPVFWNFLLYSTLILFCIFPVFQFQNRKKYILILVALLLALLPFWHQEQSRRGDLRCSFISLSHGLSVLIQFPNGKNLLFDAGQFAPPDYPVRTISEFLWNSGVHQIDALVISHPDMDHYNAIPGLMHRFSFEKIYISPQMMTALDSSSKDGVSEKDKESGKDREDKKDEVFESNRECVKENKNHTESKKPGENLSRSASNVQSASGISQNERVRQQIDSDTRIMLENLRQTVQDAQVPLETLAAGDRLELSPGCVIYVLHPTPECIRNAPTHTNANSLVLLLEYEGHRFLLTGDLAPPGLDCVLGIAPIHCDVVQAPHHGGKTCCTESFDKWCDPEYFIISESFNNAQTVTTKLFQKNGATVHHTGREGAVIFIVKDGKMGCARREDWKKWH